MSEAENPADDAARRSRPESAAERRARRKAAAVGGKATPDKAGKTKTAPGRSGAGTQRTKIDVKDKRPSLPARFMRFLREVVDELRKVIWPTRKQMVTYTIVVVVFVAFIVALVAGLDWVFGKAMFALFG